MRAGELRRRIQIVAQLGGQDAGGQPVAAIGPAALFLACWSSIHAVSSREVYALGAGFSGQVTHKITIRKPDTPPTTGMQVLYNGRTFVIQTTSDPDESGRELDLMCLEQTK